MRPAFLFRSSQRHARFQTVGRHDRAGARPGRLLVECCVSMVLLAGTGALVLLVAANTAHLVDDSRQRDRVQRAAVARLSGALAVPCRVTDAITREPVGPRGLLHIVSTNRRAVHTVSVDAWWQASGLGGTVWRRRATTISGWCE